LIVAIAIIGILVSLLMTAIHKVRDGASRLACANNMKQIGLALHAFHDSSNHLPPGRSTTIAQFQFFSLFWLPRILPYIEQNALWNSIAKDYTISNNPFVHPTFSLHIKLFACPSDPRVVQAHLTHQQLTVASSSYLGVNGENYKKLDGIFYLNSSTRFADILDGTSNTLMVGERPPSTDYWYGWWYAGRGQEGTGSGDSVLGVREFRSPSASQAESCPIGFYPFQVGKFSEQCDFLHFWSPHASGANFVFADGSVRFMSYSSRAVMPALSTRAGNEVASFD
jgi:prepilin-type processing-associated H-X9-DG protein